MKKSFAISTLFHFILLLAPSLIFSHCGGNGAGNGDKKGLDSPEGKIVPKPEKGEEEPIEVEIIILPAKKKSVYTDRECPGAWFGGIGIDMGINQSAEYFVAIAHEGYPASKSGMESGDVIVSNHSAILGEPGTEVTVTIRKKDGSIVDYTMAREKICTESKP